MLSCFTFIYSFFYNLSCKKLKVVKLKIMIVHLIAWAHKLFSSRTKVEMEMTGQEALFGECPRCLMWFVIVSRICTKDNVIKTALWKCHFPPQPLLFIFMSLHIHNRLVIKNSLRPYEYQSLLEYFTKSFLFNSKFS